MIVCVCNNVSDREIAAVVQGGCASFQDLQERTGLALACAACHDCARYTFDLHARPRPQRSGSASAGGFAPWQRLLPTAVSAK